MSTMVDPIRLEVIKNALDTIADEMALIVVRSAWSGIVRDAMDFSTAVCDAQGRTLAQGLTTALHLGSFHDAMEHLVARHGAATEPGDVFIFNDPYEAAGQHLPDIYIVKPLFMQDRLVAWATTVAHHNDVGGIVPGSNSLGAQEIFQEGLRLPMLKLSRAGRDSSDIWEIIRINVRVPDKVSGDLRAQIAACNAAEKGIADLFRRYGGEGLAFYFDQIHEYSEQLARAEFRDMPDGVYRFENYIDGLGEEPEPIPFRVKLTIAGDAVEVDWAGTSPQVKAGINSPVPFTKAAAYTALRSVLGSELPNSQGFTRPIKVVMPDASIVNPRFPAACGARGITGMRMIDCLMGALSKAVPHKVPADNCGGATLPAMGGYFEGKPFVYVETIMGNSGGSPAHDGQDGISHLAGNQSNIPVEMVENEYPLRVVQYGLVADTGGAGLYRGGLSIVREFELLADEATLTVRSDKRAFRPYGLAGGQPGASSWNALVRDGRERVLPVLLMRPETMRKGDRYRHVMAGGGGYGDPLDRDLELVLNDVIGGKVSASSARGEYGVVLTGEGRRARVNAAATAALRAGMRAHRPSNAAGNSEHKNPAKGLDTAREPVEAESS
jgi:N-methylhydantoinase B